jgi:hypothetical protein
MFIVVADPNEENCVRSVWSIPKNKTLEEAQAQIRDVYENPWDFDDEDKVWLKDVNPQPEEILERLGYELQHYTSIDLSQDDIEE